MSITGAPEVAIRGQGGRWQSGHRLALDLRRLLVQRQDPRARTPQRPSRLYLLLNDRAQEDPRLAGI